MLKFIYLFFLLLPSLVFSQNEKITNYRKAKKVLADIYKDRQNTFYCNCAYEKKSIDIKSCGVETSNHRKRLRKMEWEHIVPASRFGINFIEWTEGDDKCVKKRRPIVSKARSAALGNTKSSQLTGIKKYKGRKCARKASTEFNKIEADLHNLRPSVGAINGTRENFKFAEGIHILAPQFGKCDLKIIDDQIEPRNEIKGNIARIYLYMASSYPSKVVLSKEELEMFNNWSKWDPVDQKECSLDQLIADRQGNHNSFVLEQCKKLK